jgi:hypothetical protein
MPRVMPRRPCCIVACEICTDCTCANHTAVSLQPSLIPAGLESHYAYSGRESSVAGGQAAKVHFHRGSVQIMTEHVSEDYQIGLHIVRARLVEHEPHAQSSKYLST